MLGFVQGSVQQDAEEDRRNKAASLQISFHGLLFQLLTHVQFDEQLYGEELCVKNHFSFIIDRLVGTKTVTITYGVTKRKCQRE